MWSSSNEIDLASDLFSVYDRVTTCSVKSATVEIHQPQQIAALLKSAGRMVSLGLALSALITTQNER